MNQFVLEFNKNQIITLPLNLYQLNELENLDLSQNKLKSFPLNLSQAKSIKQIDLSGNPFDKLHIKQIKEKLLIQDLKI